MTVGRSSAARLVRAAAVLFFLTVVAVLAGCGGDQAATNPQSHQARRIDTLWWGLMIAGWIGLASVVALLVAAYLRRHRDDGEAGDRRGWAVVVTNGIAIPLVIVVAVFVIGDVFVIRTTQAPAASETKMTVEVIGHQWWWEVRYPGTSAVTANEIHIPARTPVRLTVRTADVIHSFWVPELNRKIDTLPEHANDIVLEADRPGRFRGQCAEFCGVQHANMSMYVFAQEPADFRAWLARESRAAAQPRSDAEARGGRAFVEGPCSSCHTIRGTPADGDVGPDLTHLASRTTIGAVTLVNDRAHLAEWITNGQHVKPGNQMPNIPLGDRQLSDLLDYLRSLR